MQTRLKITFIGTLAGLALGAHGDCIRHELPQAYFGDLHVHTALSNDANGMGIRALPDDAYRYARGETIAVNDTLSITPGWTLDFAAVTDHAEQLGAATLCHNPQSPSFQSWSCKLERNRPRLGLLLGSIAGNFWGEPGGPHCAHNACKDVQRSAWQETVRAAETANDPCVFTSFVAYEWTGNGSGGATIHRNVIFNGNPDLSNPFSALDYKTPEALFGELRKHCVDKGTGCDALTIPHNSNLSKGQMFPRKGDDPEINIADRHYFDRLAEIIQHKGASECYSGVGATDEACSFEALPYASFLGKFLPIAAKRPENDTSNLREALKEGLRFDASNPYQLGLIGSTDTHLATAGQVQERRYREHHNKNQRIEGYSIPKQAELNPGGLAVIYAHSNTRQDLFDSMKRREVYGTSGTRIGLRFFASDDLPEDLCNRTNALTIAYTHGQPMGGTVSHAKAPSFFAMANSAPDGTPLQSLQLVKAWIDVSGTEHEKVITLNEVPKADNPSCALSTSSDKNTFINASNGKTAFCAQWQDPDFNADQPSVYYLRVLEQPTCRWNQAVCSELPADIAAEASTCQTTQTVIQERAWSSPIWFTAKDRSTP
ncbi:DUF3604 domain-containing protein [Litorivivens sp.]|uniref:DUF3604 domain-containing protein n=1 Tax=Litorivivens sp. TaxID=2020868 RepID=UPI00356317D9